VRLRELILYALALRDVLFDFFLISQVEGNRAEDLHEAERRVMRSNGLGRFAVLETPGRGVLAAHDSRSGRSCHPGVRRIPYSWSHLAPVYRTRTPGRGREACQEPATDRRANPEKG